VEALLAGALEAAAAGACALTAVFTGAATTGFNTVIPELLDPIGVNSMASASMKDAFSICSSAHQAESLSSKPNFPGSCSLRLQPHRKNKGIDASVAAGTSNPAPKHRESQHAGLWGTG
jgi:hypothetical protein